MSLLQVNSITKHYPSFTLDHISFSLEPGFILGYIGPNGAGKTTTLDLITNLQECDEGSVTINGLSFKEDPVRYRELIGYVGDSSFFPEDFYCRDIRRILADFYPTFSPEQFDTLCRDWKLPQKETIKTWSRGMRVKLMFASVLSRQTRLLVLDEATNGLDPLVRREVLAMLQNYIADGQHSVIFSTHIMEDLSDISDYIFLICGGKKILFDERDELLERFVLVKGDPSDLDESVRSRLIGLEKHTYGFTALFDADSGENLPSKDSFSFEKPTIDQLVMHLLIQNS